jgi:iron complex outermembrane receptor protein
MGLVKNGMRRRHALLIAHVSLAVMLGAQPTGAQQDGPLLEEENVLEEAEEAGHPEDTSLEDLDADRDEPDLSEGETEQTLQPPSESDEELADRAAQPTSGDAPAADRRGIEEIEVTATRRQQASQDIPISLVAFDGTELEAARVTDIRDLADYTPNLEIKTATGASNPTLFIRGIGLNDFNSNASSSVAVYSDGVYMNSPAGQLFQLFDVERVEVLRGPQGSLYGRNATAGALQVWSRKPDGAFSADTIVTYGNYDAVEVTGALAFPIVSDVLSARIAGRMNRRDGITENRCAGPIINQRIPRFGVENQCRRLRATDPPIPPGLPDRVNDIDNWASRAIFKLDPSDSQEWTLNVHGGQSRANALQLQLRGVRPPILNGAGQGALDYGDRDRDPFAGDYDLVGPEELDLFGSGLSGEIELDTIRLKSITAYEWNSRSILDNTDAGPRVIIHSDTKDSAWQASQELIVSSLSGDRFEWDLGGFALYEQLEADNTFNTRIVAPVPTLTTQDIDQELFTWALFGHATYQATDQIRFDGGLRYNWERKRFRITASNIPLGPGFEVQNVDGDETETWDAFTGDVVLTWQPTEEVSTYVKYSRGFKGGHFNGGAVFSAQVVEAVEPESVNAYEIGLKSNWFDRQLILNAAFFYYDYENYQVFALRNDPGSIPIPQLLNAPKVTSRGFEIDLQMTPADGLFMSVGIGVLDAEFTEFAVLRSFRDSTAGCPRPPRCPVVFEVQDFSGNPLVAAPPVTVTAVAHYDVDLGRFGTLTPRLDASYKGRTYFDPGDATANPPQPLEAASQDPFWLLNARLAYRTPNDRIEVAGWVRNAMDKAYLIDSFDVRNGLGAFLDVYGTPRTYGVTISMRWE